MKQLSVAVDGLAFGPSRFDSECFFSNPANLFLGEINHSLLDFGILPKFETAISASENVIVIGEIVVVNKNGIVTASASECNSV